jgi:hypothetical protein
MASQPTWRLLGSWGSGYRFERTLLDGTRLEAEVLPCEHGWPILGQLHVDQPSDYSSNNEAIGELLRVSNSTIDRFAGQPEQELFAIVAGFTPGSAPVRTRRTRASQWPDSRLDELVHEVMRRQGEGHVDPTDLGAPWALTPRRVRELLAMAESRGRVAITRNPGTRNRYDLPATRA